MFKKNYIKPYINVKNKKNKKKSRKMCNIDYKILPIPKLKSACKGQNKLKGNKCFRNFCYRVRDILSSKDNFLGNVVLIDNPNDPNEKLVCKWNRYREHRENMLNEVKMQNIAYTLGIAPKIIETYEDGTYFYIIMENLIKKGYNTIYNIYMKNILNNYWEGDGGLENLYIPENVLQLIGKGLNQLHNHGIIHGDLHPQNVFYNTKTHQIMFIDFGLSKKFYSKQEAIDNEKFYFTYWITYYGNNSTLPKNWLNIINYY